MTIRYGLTPPDWKPSDDDHLSEVHRQARMKARAEAEAMLHAKGAAATPAAIDPWDIEIVGESLATRRIVIPLPHTLGYTARPEAGPIVNTVAVQPLGAMSVEDCIRTGLITTRGFSRHVFDRLVRERQERTGAGPWPHPFEPWQEVRK